MRSTKESEAPIAWGEHEDGDSLYNMSRDTYTCDICGLEEKWDAHDDRRGDLWECDYCGKHFCTACFVGEAGIDAGGDRLCSVPRALQRGSFRNRRNPIKEGRT